MKTCILRSCLRLLFLMPVLALAVACGGQHPPEESHPRATETVAETTRLLRPELLQADIAVDHVNNLGWTALLEAIILGDCGPRHTEVVRLLVEAGADVNLADGGGVTPLEHARQRGCTRVAEVLQSAGAV